VLIKHLQVKKIICQRLESLADLPQPAQLPPAPVKDRIQKVTDSVLTLKDTRPRKIKPLTAFIKGQLNNHATEVAVNEVIARLTQAGMSIEPQGNLIWPST
jgi:hypothetical protein